MLAERSAHALIPDSFSVLMFSKLNVFVNPITNDGRGHVMPAGAWLLLPVAATFASNPAITADPWTVRVVPRARPWMMTDEEGNRPSPAIPAATAPLLLMSVAAAAESARSQIAHLLFSLQCVSIAVCAVVLVRAGMMSCPGPRVFAKLGSAVS